MKTVTFETAKRLYDLGVDFYTERLYILYNFENKNIEGCIADKSTDPFTDDLTEYIPAPDAQELLDKMPEYIVIDGDECHLQITLAKVRSKPEDKLRRDYHLCYSLMTGIHGDESLSEALAEKMMWLVKNGYVTVEEINKGE